MKLENFQFVRKKDKFVLEAIIPPYYGYQKVCSGDAFYRNRGSKVAAFEKGKGFALFAFDDDSLYTGPEDVFDYIDSSRAFIYQKKKHGDWFEKSFDMNDEKKLGDRQGNFFVYQDKAEKGFTVFMYDETGNRRRFECKNWENAGNYSVFRMKNGLYEVYYADKSYPEKVKSGNLNLENQEGKRFCFQWNEEKKAYEKV